MAAVAVAGCGPSAPNSPGSASEVGDSKKSPLYVADGGHVAGYGVVVSDGRESRLCRGPAGNAEGGPVTYPSTPCPDGVLLRGFSTSDLMQVGSVRAGNARISGVWRQGGVDVQTQSPSGEPEPLEPIASDSSKVPCPEPSGGWSDVRSFPQEDYPAAVLKLREQHPDDPLGGFVLAPTEQQRVLGFAAADADAAGRITEALTPMYGDSICVVVSPYTTSDYRRAAQGATHVYEVREREFAQDLTMVVRWFAIVVDDKVQTALDQLPPGLVRLQSVLKPTTASSG
jgi:hypothetical protein